MAIRRWRDDPMVRARWILVLLGAAALGLVFLVSGDLTVRFTAGFAAGAGLAVWTVSERIIVSTRDRPETRVASARQGSIER
ncbi:hypothetical protein [Actinomadura rubrisoli]|uniref:Uncharacterized protein n=1 Tax=Actinomadura rubrisoli TaxID=2530368 RepID=A0A4R5C5Z2_9ACTN|nr:hypothetical protein [Actinomadura rubrisoli]TDD93513.1 hypothetical protein E1298_09295 [Actinomadura rubrisoli]